MDGNLDQANKAEYLKMTQGRSATLGEPPGPPLQTPRRKKNKKPPIDADLNGDPLSKDKVEDLLDNTTQILQGPLLDLDIDNNKTSLQPPSSKGKGRA
ncbi:hypothetical protein DFH28DRAFT_859751, partial [Melampsora americana]